MIWVILIAIVGYILYRFFSALMEDNNDLQGRTLDNKFEFIVDILNDYAFNRNGVITYIDKREFNLYQTGENQIIKFQYSTGHLTITWKYKYFQKEVVHERQFNNVRNISVFEQQKIAESMISEMVRIVERHKINVMSNI